MDKTALIALLIPCIALAVEPSPVARGEIDHLLGYLERSGCEFNRNGAWYDAAIGRTESESSVSGKAYQVRCAGAASVPSGVWLESELMR